METNTTTKEKKTIRVYDHEFSGGDCVYRGTSERLAIKAARQCEYGAVILRDAYKLPGEDCWVTEKLVGWDIVTKYPYTFWD